MTGSADFHNILFSAGEASGDTYGAQLIESLDKLLTGATFFGLGGERMRAAGCDVLVDAKEVAVVGLVEVITHLPGIYRRFHGFVREAEKRKPDAAVLIDFPEFNLRLARKLHALGIPVFYFVSPQIWAWRSGRVKLIQKYVRKMIVIFPFEQGFYRAHGVEVSYVGHPLAYIEPETISRVDFGHRYHLDPEKEWIALLPGSRRKEVRLNLPVMVKAANLMAHNGGRNEFLLPVASTLSANWMREQIARNNTGVAIRLVENAPTALRHCRAAVVASGTATVETALTGTPFIVVYRVARLTWLLGRRLVKLDTFAMPNLIAGRRIVPELIQQSLTAENILQELAGIIPDGPKRQQMLADLSLVRQKLRDSTSGESPVERAAQEIVESLKV